VPFIGIIQAGEQALADRFMYVPILGLFMLIVWGLEAVLEPWARRRESLATAGALALTGWLVGTLLLLRHWQDSEKLFRHATEVTRANPLRLNPDSPRPHYHLALALVRQDKRQEALPHARKARDLAEAAGQSALAAKARTLLEQYQ
jgi:protein O-mannosyl-transferase